jgi:hypothetical protein
MEIQEDCFIGLASEFLGEIELCGTSKEIKTFSFARGPSLLHPMKEHLGNMSHTLAVHAAVHLEVRDSA